jgi:hypothetical protein
MRGHLPGAIRSEESRPCSLRGGDHRLRTRDSLPVLYERSKQMLFAIVEGGIGAVISTIVVVVALVAGIASDNKEGGNK